MHAYFLVFLKQDSLLTCCYTNRGWPQFIALTELNDTTRRFIKDDALTIVAELQVRLHRGLQAVPAALVEGYDEKLFVQQPVTASPCTICLGVMNDPVCCPEGHKYVPPSSAAVQLTRSAVIC